LRIFSIHSEGSVGDPYLGREQTKAKHFILRRYLQALAFKVLTFSDIAYVDGFSGPWETKTEDFSDSSFMIAIAVLRDAQRLVFERTGARRKVKCFFSESDPASFARLKTAVEPYNDPNADFEIRTFQGRFEDAVPQIQAAIDGCFPLIFIDPTGWTGYPFAKIKSLFAPRRCEVLINFMYEFINRFSYSDDQSTVASLDPILGGPGWQERLDGRLPRGLAVEKLFRETLQAVGNFEFVVSTRIDKSTTDRPHFFIAYGTKSVDGLKAFRQIEYDALREHVRSRADALARQREERSRVMDMFAGQHADFRESNFDQLVTEQSALATEGIVRDLRQRGDMKFAVVVSKSLQAFMLRETNIKDICVSLAKNGTIRNTWGNGGRKPRDSDLISLTESRLE
jgi:three-Cys-motif partner protein